VTHSLCASRSGTRHDKRAGGRGDGHAGTCHDERFGGRGDERSGGCPVEQSPLSPPLSNHG